MTQSKARPGTNLTDFYREEFLKHRRCLEQQREYYSDSAITSVEAALTRIISQLEHLSAKEDADQVVEPPAAEVQRRDRAVELDRSEERSLRRRPCRHFRQHVSDHRARRHRSRVSTSSDRSRRCRIRRSPPRPTARTCASLRSARPRRSWPTRSPRSPAIAFATASSSARTCRSRCRRSSNGFRRAIRCPTSAAWPQDGARSRLRSAPIPDETLVVLLSGGASALMAVPAGELTLEDKRTAVNALLKGGRRHHGAQHDPQTSVGGERRPARGGGAGPDRLPRDFGCRGRRSQRHRFGTDCCRIRRRIATRGITSSGSAWSALLTRRREATTCAPAWRERSPRRRKPAIRASSASVTRVIGGRFNAMNGAAEAARSLGYDVDPERRADRRRRAHDGTCGSRAGANAGCGPEASGGRASRAAKRR